ncbi:hypothetical protein ACFWPV_10155 [Streptomyces uncialis]|uniref:hypothetical protein n=1 Tax=Streptomyces uncialis TaxID=1048205 RepID=UPI003650A66E
MTSIGTPVEHTVDLDTHADLYRQLGQLIRRRVAEIRLTPQHWQDRTVWCALLLAPDRSEVPLPQGAAADIAALLTGAFPHARWDRAQDYDVETGVLTEHQVHVPAALMDQLPDRVMAVRSRAFIDHENAAARARRAAGTWVLAGFYKHVGHAERAAIRVETGEFLPAYLPPGSYEGKAALFDGRNALYVRHTSAHTARSAA